MLQMSPRTRRLMRLRAIRIRDAARGRFNKKRHKNLSERFAAFMVTEWREGRATTLFHYEGILRHELRRALVLQGWAWADANYSAILVVDHALAIAGAKRPSWDEGQPIYQERFIKRTRCTVCHKPLPEERRQFCSDICVNVAHARLHRLRDTSVTRAETLMERERGEIR